jgi:glycyl-tRNA synthetase beta chain
VPEAAPPAASGNGREDLLIEIGCEELPPGALDELRDALFSGFCDGLERERIAFERRASRSYSSPRRLAVLLRAVAAAQTDQDQERRGPAVSAAFDAAGRPTRAAEGFARSLGLAVDELERRETDKGAWLFARVHLPGKKLEEVVYAVLEQTLRQLPVPRPMRWGDHDFSFVRPVHWLVVLHGDRVLPGALFGQSAGDCTRGHRIHAPGPHRIPHAADYLATLASARVLADPEQRRERIREQVLAAHPGARMDAALLGEVTNLVEWPVAILCSFDPDFLALPHEALVASMQDQQKFFPVLESAGSAAVTNHFVAVANLESARVAEVRAGFERVIRPRLADARFFLEQDQKQSLESFLSGLDQLVFQQRIGTVGDKSRRISSLSRKIAEKLTVDPALCERAGLLAKCDLMSQMVGEFPELQGIIGRYYALHSGEPREVAEAITGHYLPRFAGDSIPPSPAGQVVAVADRADTLVGIFASGQRPTGNRDPFALRRSALGLVRILLEARLPLALDRLLALAANELHAQGTKVAPAVLGEVRDFIAERARQHFRDAGHATDLVNAALGSGWTDLPDLEARLLALVAFMGQEPAQSLAAANKRIGNILRRTDEEFDRQIEEDRLVLEEEYELYQQITRSESALAPLLERRDYAASLNHLARLRPTVDRFFDGVMVMEEDRALRHNRLALLSRLKALFDHIADLSVLG